MRRISEKQRQEKQRRHLLYEKLKAQSNGLCPQCGKPLNHRWPRGQMHHVKYLSALGPSDTENCQLWCAPCHQKETEHQGK